VKQKIVIEIVMLVITCIAMIGVYWFVTKKMGYSQTEAEEDAHLKRLFGEAWKEAKDL
jgi:hypothetical protein